MLDSIRKYSPETMVLYSSSKKVYGDFRELIFVEKETRSECLESPNRFDESLPLDFHSPFGCSRGVADQYLLDFNRIFGIKTVVFRYSSMYGGNQHSTIDQGWVGWFCQKGLDIKIVNSKEVFTISGTGKQVRDVLHVEDLVSLYFNATENIEKVKGQAFNIGGGIGFSLSLIELFTILEEIMGIEMVYKQLPARDSDQLVFVADARKINEFIGWKPKIDFNEGLSKMLNWISC